MPHLSLIWSKNHLCASIYVVKKKMHKQLIEIFGWYGTVAIIGAYALSSFSIIKPDSLIYQLLNLTGALGIVWVSYDKKVFQPVVLNLIWSVIAAIAIFNIIF